MSTLTQLTNPLRLKGYIFFAETASGVWFDAGRKSFALKGKGIYPLIERVIGMMDSGKSPAAIAAVLPEKLWPLIEHLFTALDQHGMLERSDTPLVHSPVAEFEAFLRDRVPDDVLQDRLSAWRNAKVHLIGDGYALKAAAQALATSKPGQLTVGVHETDVSLKEIGSSIEASANIQPWDGSSIPSVADIDLLVYAGCADVATLYALETAMNKAACGGLVGTHHAGRVVIAPPQRAEMVGIGACLDWLEPDDNPALPSRTQLSVMGALVAHGAICDWFDIDPEDHHGTARIVSPHMDVTPVVVPPSPQVQRVEHVSPRRKVELPDGRDLRPIETLRLELDPWFSELAGPFSTEGLEPAPQLPLYHEVLSVRFPSRSHEELRKQVVIGWGIDAEAAATHAVNDAIALLAETEFGSGALAVADIDPVRCHARARAIYLAHQPGFSPSSTVISLDDLSSPEAILLLRLLRFAAVGEVQLTLATQPDWPVAIAKCFDEKGFIAEVVAGDPDAAIAEVLGRAASACQLRGTAYDGYWKQHVIHPFESAAGKPPQTVFVASSRLGLPEGITCGVVRHASGGTA